MKHCSQQETKCRAFQMYKYAGNDVLTAVYYVSPLVNRQKLERIYSKSHKQPSSEYMFSKPKYSWMMLPVAFKKLLQKISHLEGFLQIVVLKKPKDTN